MLSLRFACEPKNAFMSICEIAFSAIFLNNLFCKDFFTI